MSTRILAEQRIGQRFGRWTVIGVVPIRRSGSERVLRRLICRCECGKVGEPVMQLLLRGDSKSCGCLANELLAARSIKHGEQRGYSASKELQTFRKIHARCGNPTDQSYPRYGGRGITVAPEWASFERFLADMGRAPSATASIDRIDNDGPYSAANCRWADHRTQANNRRSNRRLTVNGRTMTEAEWVRETGLRQGTLNARIDRGWSVEKALTTPPQQYGSWDARSGRSIGK